VMADLTLLADHLKELVARHLRLQKN